LAIILAVLLQSAGAWAASKERVLYSFKNNGKDGEVPYAGLIFDAAGNLYGTTAGGGSHGTVFELTPGGQGRWTEKVLYSFKGGRTDGDSPYAGLIFDTAGNLYGTTFKGGDSGAGIVFELTPGGNGQWSETVLHSFGSGGGGGGAPYAGLVFDAAGNLYGTTSIDATVFKLRPSNGGWIESVLYAFRGSNVAFPHAGVIFDTAGNLYGTAINNVNHFHGVVFELTPGSKGWTENVLYQFNRHPDGAYPFAGLIFDASGNLYSTTSAGGSHYRGTVFELTPGGGGKWTETVLHSFGKGVDGQYPQASLILAANGKLYGTTEEGGLFGVGTVFALTPGAHGQWTEKVVHSFGYGKDGNRPFAGLIEKDGKLYGTTSTGGANGLGTVFELTP
jgi:uncharacterized repeat protein (TIGR03803 family)